MTNIFSPMAIGAGVLGFLLVWMEWLAGLNADPNTGMVVTPEVLMISGLLLIGFGIVWAVFGPEDKGSLSLGGGVDSGLGSWASDPNNPAYWIWMQTYCPPPDQEAFNRKLAEQAKKP